MSRHEDLLLQLIQRDPDKIRSILGLPAPKPDLSWYEGAEVWIEAGHRSDRGAELRIAFGGPLPHGYADFWIPFSGPDGNALGWLRFSYITTVREKSLFTACEWRSVGEPAPAEENRLDLPVDPLPGGFAPESNEGSNDEIKQQMLAQHGCSSHHLERWLQAFERRIKEQTARLLEPLIDPAVFWDLVSKPHCPERPPAEASERREADQTGSENRAATPDSGAVSPD
ncbi:hypothetical protein [Pseudomonas aeruginosa]|uniref:hypothetical protein n=1 Tax=Pseudomonas aeruginosa TaxID=287 RepID=UPI0029CCA43F|nr:hypothetical protein [Pseudomonas aeruginosa]MEA8567871.1 hypothetical protein [Pseudomonas aeruginosa]MEA8580319.1 hypothetical protein [Pseudomonas aeruginosa]MEA8613255.1 hypothetical protein [Pseudomonas aeruginosa]HCL4186265.1 hypothetical protein [Pseudomonas aeruginosa]HEJ1277537.1 hypothetical protein [Pseudomonas aeruginosa]